MRVLVLLAALALASAQENCCPDIGCYPRSDCPHLELAECPSANTPNFRLCTRDDRSGQVLDRDNVGSIAFDPSKRTILLTHGWWGDRNTGWLEDMKEDILDARDENVITMGWGEGSIDIDYWQAAGNTQTVGGEAAYIFSQLRSRGLSESRMWCIGHSLGGHVCGFFGKRAQSVFNFTPDRITGLDPAGPEFDDHPRTCGLSNTDATFVDTIITDKGVLGTDEARGDADFFPNGGEGDHGICINYMRESFDSSCQFNARESCSDVDNIPGSCEACTGICQVMGEPARQSSGRGMFHLTANETPRHCQG